MRTRLPLLLAGGLVLAGCTAATPAARPSWTVAPASPAPAAAALVSVIDVYKSPTCTCCHEWEAYLREHGYTVNSIPVDDLAAVKAEHRIPVDAQSCHTAVIGGYAVEGHVPVEAMEALLADAPAIDGIALPGMPPGSPGMPGDKAAPFEVLAVDNGVTSAFGSY